MVYLVECHWYEKIMFKYGVGDVFMLGILLRSDV